MLSIVFVAGGCDMLSKICVGAIVLCSPKILFAGNCVMLSNICLKTFLLSKQSCGYVIVKKILVGVSWYTFAKKKLFGQLHCCYQKRCWPIMVCCKKWGAGVIKWFFKRPIVLCCHKKYCLWWQLGFVVKQKNRRQLCYGFKKNWTIVLRCCKKDNFGAIVLCCPQYCVVV